MAVEKTGTTTVTVEVVETTTDEVQGTPHGGQDRSAETRKITHGNLVSQLAATGDELRANPDRYEEL